MSTRSRTGCMTCRKRKLKCDEQKPICGQCTKARRECVPCTGIVFRHQQNASMNQGRVAGGNNLGGFYNYKNTFTENNVWVKVPERVTFVINNNPYEEGSEYVEDFSQSYNGAPQADMAAQGPGSRYYNNPNNYIHGPEWAPAQFPRQYDGSHGLEALSEAASADQYNYLPAGTLPQHHNSTKPSIQASEALNRLAASATERASSANDLRFLLNPSSPSHSSAIDPNLERAEPYSQKRAPSETAETDFEIAYLLRYFAEGPAKLIDFYDRDSYFGYNIPRQSPKNPLLRYSAAALAAKHLGHVQNHDHETLGDLSASKIKATTSQRENVDWTAKAAAYYEDAISILTEAVQLYPGDSAQVEASPSKSRSSKRRKLSPSPEYSSDDLAAATTILCHYEFMDASGGSFRWSRHFDGAKTLLDIAEESIMPTRPGPPSLRHTSRATIWTFWNVAQLDAVPAFIYEQPTRLDPEDTAIWNDAGLLLDDSGFVKPDDASDGATGDNGVMSRDDMMSSSLIWLLAKIINYAVYADNAPTTGDRTKDSYMGINQMTLHERWREIKNQVDVWRERLPSTFAPYPSAPKENGELSKVFETIRYPSPKIAATMQSYHMAEMLLLMNQPQHSTIGKTTLFKRLDSYKSIAADVEKHARSICSIASSHDDPNVRIHAMQPLFLAGQALEEPQERTEILGLLRRIQDDTGWASQYRVNQLQAYWGQEA